jgi:WS/DGAT/MGAT family acyltransferase
MSVQRIASSDAIWLQDSATNLMVINAVIITDRLDPRTLRRAFRRRVFEGPDPARFERLRCRIAGSGRRRCWERDPAFNLDRHIVATRLKHPHDPAAVQDFVGQEAGRALDPDHSPWKIHVIQSTETDATVLLVRFHHSIGDGEALLGLLFALVDETQDRKDDPAGVPAAPGSRWAGGLLRTAALPLSAPGILLRRLSWVPDRSPMHGPPLSGHKRVAWTRPLDLRVVKKARHHTGATVNDVLMASVSSAFSRYLEAHGEAAPSRYLVSMPMNMRSLGKASRCENHFAPVPLELPAGPGSRAQRILEVKARMDQVKCSMVPLVIYNLQRALVTFLPQPASRALIDFLANKCTAVVSNIKGPVRDLTLEGRRVRSMLFWVPQRARIGIGISILSFSGKVQVGVMADEALVPDPEALVAAFEAEFDALRGV